MATTSNANPAEAARRSNSEVAFAIDKRGLPIEKVVAFDAVYEMTPLKGFQQYRCFIFRQS